VLYLDYVSGLHNCLELSHLSSEKVFYCLIMTILLQLDKIMKEKEAQFLEEKSNLWKELTDGFKKVRFRFVQSFNYRSS